MDSASFRRYGHELVDWVADYMDHADRYPVRPRVQPGDIRAQLPAAPPEGAEDWDRILADFRDIVMPGITHWNHPRFFAYFPCNHSGPAILGELLSAGLGVNAMNWQTSPAATELEEVVMDWLRQMLGLPPAFRGAIQDTASTATLAALIAARERLTRGAVNRDGLGAWPERLRVYTSAEAHSSVEKDMMVAGFGAANLVKVPVDADYAMDPAALERLIAVDRAAGLAPCAVVATVGTTSSTAVDPVPAIAAIARRHALWLHVDAALAGSAAILPEGRGLLAGVAEADSFVFNPHKWLFTNFDCSAFFCRDPETLVAAMSVTPEYLKTAHDRRVTNFRDWGVQLGRRFRALKLWFVIRSYGVEGLRAMLREHLALAREFAAWVDAQPDFERLAPVPVNTVCFRFNPWRAAGGGDPAALDRLNAALLEAVNATGRIMISHTKLGGRYTLRMCIGQTRTHREHVLEAMAIFRAAASSLDASS